MKYFFQKMLCKFIDLIIKNYFLHVNFFARFCWEWLTFTHEVVTTTLELVTDTQMAFIFLNLNENVRSFKEIKNNIEESILSVLKAHVYF